MNRKWIAMFALTILATLPTVAHAQRGYRGYRGNGVAMTPYGPVQNPTFTPEYRLWASNPAAYEQLMYEREQQALVRQQQAMLKEQQQMLKARQEWTKKQAALAKQNGNTPNVNGNPVFNADLAAQPTGRRPAPRARGTARVNKAKTAKQKLTVKADEKDVEAKDKPAKP